jgi:hypothetical protein
MVGHHVRVRQFGIRTSESLLSEVPDAIQVQVLQGPRTVVGNTTLTSVQETVQLVRLDSMTHLANTRAFTSLLRHEPVLGGEGIPGGISVPVVLRLIRHPQRDVTAMEMFNQSEGHIHASRYTRRSPPVSIFDPTSLGHPFDALAL